MHLSEGLVLNLCAYLVEIGTLLELRKEALYPFVHLPSLFFRRSLPLACHTITQVHFACGSVVSSEPLVTGCKYKAYNSFPTSKDNHIQHIPIRHCLNKLFPLNCAAVISVKRLHQLFQFTLCRLFIQNRRHDC